LKDDQGARKQAASVPENSIEEHGTSKQEHTSEMGRPTITTLLQERQTNALIDRNCFDQKDPTLFCPKCRTWLRMKAASDQAVRVPI
jgi:hypothetical protein